MSVTKISSCTTTSCAFNNGGCTAFAITVGGDNGAPACDTFISLDARGGLHDPQPVLGDERAVDPCHDAHGFGVDEPPPQGVALVGAERQLALRRVLPVAPAPGALVVCPCCCC